MADPTILWSNVAAPSAQLVEQAAAPSAPASGRQRLYVKTDGHVHAVDDAAVDRDIEAIQQTLSADPASPVDGTWWVTDDGGSPAAIKLRFRKSGVSYTLAEVTV